MTTTGLKPLDQAWERVEAARLESADALFDALLYCGEAFFKTYAAALLAAIPDEKDRHRYRLCHRLVRANGLGEWDEVLGDIAVGPASSHLLPAATPLQQELTARCGRGAWLYESTTLLHRVLSAVVPDCEPLPTRFDGRRWFSLYVQFRNKTRGHGAVPHSTIGQVVGDLETSLVRITSNSILTAFPWAYLRRNLSGKYNVLCLCRSSPSFEKLKSSRDINLPDGVYIDYDTLCRAELIETTLDGIDFYYPNGHFSKRESEWISYASGTRRAFDATAYLPPPTELPPSTTAGHAELQVIGRALTNLPPPPVDYVVRDELETELANLLMDERHAIVTLTGRGGIGKTSLALQVLHRICHHPSERFLSILWLSARDIDLLPSGPKLVQPASVTLKDVALQVSKLLQPQGWDDRQFKAESYLANLLSSPTDGPYLIVFDNFETVRNPIDVFSWLDSCVRVSNKILITTRHRDFRGDYPLEVGGMTEPQCDELVQRTASSLQISQRITPQLCKDIYRESEGHPYVAKILVGEIADGKHINKIERIVAGKDDLLEALFERTYKRLSPASRRVFMMLSSWRSLVAHVGLEAALMRPTQPERIDVGAAVDELRRVSFINERQSPDGHILYSVPLVASIFGKQKLAVSSDRICIDDDVRFLHRFGAMQPSDVRHGLKPRIERLFSTVADEIVSGRTNLQSELPVLGLVARHYPPAWLSIADLFRESTDSGAEDQELGAVLQYIQCSTPGPQLQSAWERIAAIHRGQDRWVDFVDAYVHIAELPGVELSTISSCVNTFNSVAKRVDSHVRMRFAKRLAVAMEPKIMEGDATDCSRLAWLLLNCGQDDRAAQIVDCGLTLDSKNEYCMNLNSKIWLPRLNEARKNRDVYRYVDAICHLAPYSNYEFQEVSEGVNWFNTVVADVLLHHDEKAKLARRLGMAVEKRIGEAGGTDLSRLAWLWIHAGEKERARQVIELGLQLDPSNAHLKNLNMKAL